MGCTEPRLSTGVGSEPPGDGSVLSCGAVVAAEPTVTVLCDPPQHGAEGRITSLHMLATLLLAVGG